MAYTNLIFNIPEGPIRLTIEKKDLKRMMAMLEEKGVPFTVKPIRMGKSKDDEENYKPLRDGDLQKIFLYQLEHRIGYLEAKEALHKSGEIKYEE